MKRLSLTARLRTSRHASGCSSLLGLSIVVAALTAPSVASAATRYVFATFLGDDASKENLSLYTSKNGVDFTLLANTGFAGPTNVLRDPSIIKHTDGQYYIAYTLKSWTTTSASFAIASSPDLKTWTFRTEVPAQVSGVKDTWAPEWFKDADGSVHLIVSIDTDTTQFKSYLYTASDNTLSKWGAPVPLGIGPNYIDTFVVKVGALYHAFTKNETTKYIEHATSDALTGPWTFVGKGDWAGWGSGKEGPALFQLENGQWRLFMDCYGNCGFLQASSSDLNSWSTTSKVPVLSGVVRHGTVLREDDSPAGSGGASGGGANHGGASNAGTGGLGANSGGAGGASSPSQAGRDGGGNGGVSSAEGGTPNAVAGSANPVGGGSPAANGGADGNSSHAGTAAVSLAGASAGSTTPSEGCSCSSASAGRSPRSALTLLFAAFAVLQRRRFVTREVGHRRGRTS
jgi:MYXO-CTERM domain-containing protein